MIHTAERVVITGLGSVTPIGPDVSLFWSNLIAGHTGYHRVTCFDTSGQKTHIGCEVPAFDEGAYHVAGHPGGRAAAMAIAAAGQALRQAGIDPASDPLTRVGVSLGTTMGEIRLLETYVEETLAAQVLPDPGRVAGYPCSTIPQGVALYFGLRGPNLMVPTACAAGNYAIGIGRDLLLRGEADIMLVGGVDPYSRVAHTGFNRLLSMSPDICRPFDLHRRGIVLGEGAGILVLEKETRARERGAAILALVLGYGLSNDAHHITNPDPTGNGLVRAMERAMDDSGLGPETIDYISAHGTGTPANDAAETKAIKAFLGARAALVPASSIKSMIGHTMGAASALEAVASVMALRTGIIPPTMNLEHPDPECDLDYVPNHCRHQAVRTILSNSMAFGGNNACLVLGAFRP